jgi:hypothetical protein
MPLESPTRPASYADWASGVSGAARITEPTQLEKNLGWQASAIPPSTYENWRGNLIYQWQRFFDLQRATAHVGRGVDGDLILVNQTWTATRPMEFRDLAIGASGVFRPNGYPWTDHVLTGLSGTIEGRGPVGGTGHGTGSSGSYATGPLPSAGPLRGYTGNVQNVPAGYNVSGFFNALGGRGGTGGRGNQLNFLPALTVGTTGKLILTPPEGLLRVFAQNGPTLIYAQGGGPGAEGRGDDGFNDIAARGGGGGDLICGIVGDVDFVGTVDVRGGDGGRGVRALGTANSGGPGGGGGGGALILGYGRLRRFDVNYIASGGQGGLGGSGPSPTISWTGFPGSPGLAGPSMLLVPLF